MAAFEQTGARDLRLLDWHRRAGLICRAAGVQLLMLEYDRAVPVGVIDYRRYEDGVPHTDHPIYRALARLCGDLPFLLAFYDRPTWGFCVWPINAPARRLVERGEAQLMSEAQYVEWLHRTLRTSNAPMRPGFPRGLGTNPPAGRPQTPMGVPGLLELDGTTWPGEELSRHRRENNWGRNVPAVDLDFLLIDNDDALPLALVEYKATKAENVDLGHTNIRAQQAFARDLPFFVVLYPKGDDPNFTIKMVVNPPPVTPQSFTSALEWLRFLRSLRVAHDFKQAAD